LIVINRGEEDNLALTLVFVVVEIVLVGLPILGVTGHFD
jgi:hypothetical protein